MTSQKLRGIVAPSLPFRRGIARASAMRRIGALALRLGGNRCSDGVSVDFCKLILREIAKRLAIRMTGQKLHKALSWGLPMDGQQPLVEFDEVIHPTLGIV